MRPLRPAATIFALVLMAVVTRPVAAQMFGKNKVQYEPLDWSVIETPHLRLHYYAEVESLARRLVRRLHELGLEVHVKTVAA